MSNRFVPFIKSRLAAYSADRRGTIAIAFGLTAATAMLTVAVALDYTRALASRAELQSAVDAVALRAMQEYSAGSRGTTLINSATSYLAAIVHDSTVSLDAGMPALNAAGTAICASVTRTMPSTLMKVANINSISLHASACSSVSGAGTLEIALVLDTTGSMGNATSDGSTKIDAMKTAANNFIDYMFDTSPLKANTKMSVVPFASAVKVDPATYNGAAWFDLSGASSESFKSPAFVRDASIAASRFALFTQLKAIKSSWDWTGCVESLPYPRNVTDTPPVLGTPDSYFVPMLAPDEPDSSYIGTITSTSYNWYTRSYVTTTSTGTIYNSNSYDNNYLDDDGGTCTTSPSGETVSDETTKESRACKYKGGTRTSSSNGPNIYCYSDSLIRMQSAKASLKTKVSGLVANGDTNIHEGFMWGWRTLSPNAPFSDGRSYTATTNTKTIVLMTDGTNTWSSLNNAINKSTYGAYGYYATANSRLPTTNQNITNSTDARAAMDQLTREACSNARAQGIIIYTVGFSGKYDPIDTQGKQLLTDCAGDSTRAFFTNSSTGLVSAFSAISAGLGSGNLRLTN
ncbi:pilus assembly protein [Roseiarcaceae bacterium H3SJ34-1]|uniref:pilus assembly protein TadG-related protein n=1 Tax=Terripilifer ovatus TaxID=3032367 RepID=UPI003AB979B8|nr:pilus assembly protein [Roseiarcaceae bacterium H3SJ34-1]